MNFEYYSSICLFYKKMAFLIVGEVKSWVKCLYYKNFYLKIKPVKKFLICNIRSLLYQIYQIYQIIIIILLSQFPLLRNIMHLQIMKQINTLLTVQKIIPLTLTV